MIFRSRLMSRLAAALTVGLVATLVGPVSPAPAATPVAPVASSWSGSSSSRASITLSRPPGTGGGHVMVASIVAQDDVQFSAPAGWAVLRNDAILDTLRQSVYVKVAGPSEPPSYTWTLPEWRRVAGGITTYSGVDPIQPVDTSAASSASTSGTAVTAPSVTTSVPEAMLVHLAAVKAEGTFTPPAGMTERWEAASSNGANANDALASSSDVVQVTAGPTGAPDRHGQPGRAADRRRGCPPPAGFASDPPPPPPLRPAQR